MILSEGIKNAYKWIYPENKELSQDLIDTAGSEFVAKLLYNRGIDTQEKIKIFLNSENIVISCPYLFEDMKKTVERINTAVEKQESIVIYGDFDADGVTSTALLYKTLKHMGANVSYFIPDRSEEGHGLNSGSVCKLISSRKAKLIITVDCGISNISEISLAKGLGTDVIITDHHEPPENIPPAYAIINPKLSEDSTLKYLAGVGVSYKLALALLESQNKRDFSSEILPLAAVGTIADVVPLIGENRVIVVQGLKLFSENRSLGLIKLLEVAGCNIDNGISSEMIAYSVAPRINAIGRIAEASLAVELLISEDNDEADIIAKKLNYNNKIRQQMCESLFIEAEARIKSEVDLENEKAIVLADNNWHPGIIGIVASKISEKHFKPVFLISTDNEANEARCSARGVEGIHLFEVLNECSGLFKQFGGHALAAGFVADISNKKIEEIMDRIKSVVRSKTGSQKIEPVLKIDMDLKSTDLSIELINSIKKLAPFGEGNPAPLFSINNLVIREFKTMGANNNHLKIFFCDNSNNIFEGVWWQKSSLDFKIAERVNVAFFPEINTFNGKSRIQLVIKDIQKSDRTNNNQLKANINQTSSVYSTPKFVDHRNKPDIEKTMSNYFRSNSNNAVIFAEDRETLERIEKYEVLKSKVISRLNIPKSSQLMLFDLPSSVELMKELLITSEAKIVHIVGLNQGNSTPNNLIKTLSGMLKYAHVNKNGEIDVNQAASFLNTEIEVVLSCLRLLHKGGIIKAISKTDNIVQFEFKNAVDIASLTSLTEHEAFIQELKNTSNFRKKMALDKIEDIQKYICSAEPSLIEV